MNRGRIEQVGTPDEVYARPRNVFVAGFIGSPQMNMWRARVRATGGDVVELTAPGLVLRLTGGRARELARLGKGEAIVGVRPEHMVPVELLPRGAAPGNVVEGVVELVEPLGADTIIHVRTGEVSLTARAPGSYRPSPGAEIRLAVEEDYIHVFDAESGERLL